MKQRVATGGFTIVELVMVIVVIAILATVVVVSYNGIRERAYTSTATAELSNIANAMARYKVIYGTLPADTSEGIPPEIVQEMTGRSQAMVDTKAWPGSYYDYEVWDLNYDGADETFQISIRFCRDNNGNPQGENGPNCRFPNEPWAKDFVDISSVFYCLEGYCKAHKFMGDVNTPAYCVNCSDHKSIPVPS